MEPVRLLLVDDEPGIRELYARLLTRAGFRVNVAATGPEALERLASDPAEVMITDIRMPGMDGIELVTRARAVDPHLKVIIITAHADVESAIAAVNFGAFGYLRKPFSKQELMDALDRALTVRTAEKAQTGPEPAPPCEFAGIVGQSEPLKQVFRMVRRVASRGLPSTSQANRSPPSRGTKDAATLTPAARTGTAATIRLASS